MLRTLVILATIITVGIALMGSGFAADKTITTGPANPERVVIGLDMSTSNPLVSDTDHASKMAMRVAEQLKGLSVRSEVIVRTFGVYGSAANDKLRIDMRISKNNPPDQLAKKVERVIKGIPGYVETGKLEAQPYTNIIAFLENMDLVVDCNSMPTTYILLTDGLEDSEYARLRNANAALPASVAMNAGQESCDELQILGLGKGLGSPSETRRLRNEWAAWATGAGRPFVRFVGLNDW